MLHLNVQEREQTSIQRISVSFRFETKQFYQKGRIEIFLTMHVQYRKLVGGGVDGLTHLTSEHSVLCVCPTNDELIFYMYKLLPKMPSNNCEHFFCHLCEGRHGVYYGVFRTLCLATFLRATKIYC